MMVLKKDGLNMQSACGIFNDMKTVMKIFVLEYIWSSPRGQTYLFLLY